MSKKTRELFEQLKAGEQSMGAVQAAVEGVQAVAPGLSLSKILGDIGSELKQQAAHGSHELAATLFSGNAYVMYPRQQGHDDPQHGLPEMQQEQEQGGREL